MKKVRPFTLPEGWISGNCEAVLNDFSLWSESSLHLGQFALIPHAGWYFSGEMAFRALSRLNNNCDLVILTGGHLSESSVPLLYEEVEFETPCGNLFSHRSSLEFLKKSFPFFSPAVDTDNSVEVHLPMLHHLFPDAEFCFLRLPPVRESVDILQSLTGWADKKGISWVFAASSDLCHYGPGYRFMPGGSGLEAKQWFFRKNREFMDLIIEGQIESVMTQGLQGAACSLAGAAFLAHTIFERNSVPDLILQKSGSSLDKMDSESFVGYGALVF